MQPLNELWAGRLYGTNTGNLFIQLNQYNQHVKGVVRINDALYGLAIYDFTGTFDEKLNLHCIPRASFRGIELSEVQVIAYLTPEGNLKGTWESTVGTAGTFEAFPHNIGPFEQDRSRKENIPEQIFNKTIQIGSVRLYGEDIKEVIDVIKRDFTIGRAIVTFSQRGSEATKFAEDFEAELKSLGDLRALKITIQEPEAYGINRIVVVELSENGPNEVKVSGINESWVAGKAVSISKALEKYKNSLVTTYKKFGLNINQIIFLTMLILLPEIASLPYRAGFLCLILILLYLLVKIHTKFIPNTLILLSEQKAGSFDRAWPSILSWLIAFSSALLAALVYYWLTKSGNP